LTAFAYRRTSSLSLSLIIFIDLAYCDSEINGCPPVAVIRRDKTHPSSGVAAKIKAGQKAKIYVGFIYIFINRSLMSATKG
jgi:hypothetical protein